MHRYFLKSDFTFFFNKMKFTNQKDLIIPCDGRNNHYIYFFLYIFGGWELRGYDDCDFKINNACMFHSQLEARRNSELKNN